MLAKLIKFFYLPNIKAVFSYLFAKIVKNIHARTITGMDILLGAGGDYWWKRVIFEMSGCG